VLGGEKSPDGRNEVVQGQVGLGKERDLPSTRCIQPVGSPFEYEKVERRGARRVRS
jgi:hypothetical protein